MLKWFGYFFLFPWTKCSFFAASRMKKTIYFSDCVDDNLKRELLLVKCICTLYNNRHPLGTFLCILRLVSWYIWTYRHPILGPFFVSNCYLHSTYELTDTHWELFYELSNCYPYSTDTCRTLFALLYNSICMYMYLPTAHVEHLLLYSLIVIHCTDFTYLHL